MTTQTIPPAPDTIGPYRVLKSIARGGMAEVYEVEDRASGERYALKLLAHTGSALPRFNREYEALTRLNHPNIVRVYQYGLHQAAPWIAMELLAGVPLQVRVKASGKPGDPVRTAEVARVIGHVAEALQYIHDRGLVHRDLKSDNVVVLPDGRVKLLDFGTAYLYDALEPITKEGEFVGTFAYAAPEQIAGGAVDHRADLYSLGILLYRLATGQRPFESSDPATLARMHAKVQPRSPREVVPDLPKELEQIILWMLAKKPEQRPSKADSVAKALREIPGVPKAGTGLGVLASPDQAVGREAELRQAISLLDGATAGAAVLVEGGEGSGRVRFTRALASEAEDRGWMTIQCTLSADRSLNDLLETLDEAAKPLRAGARAEGRTAAEVLRRQIEQGTFDGTRRREALRKAAGLVLAERARIENRPVLVVLHEMHQASTLTLDLITGLRREVASAGMPVRFVVGCRDATEDGDTLVRQRLPDARLLPLRALSVRGVALTVGAILHRRQPPADLARRIHIASGGQPAYVEEVVRQLVARGALAVRGLDGNRLEWVQRERGVIPLAPSARQGVDRALRRLPLAERRVLEALAVVGDDVTPALVARGMGCEPEQVMLVLEALVDQGWLRWDDEDDPQRVSWSRSIAPQVLLEQLHPCRHDLLRRAFVDGFAYEVPSVGQIRLLLDSDRVEDAAIIATKCSDSLLQRGSPTQAAEILDEVVQRLNASGPAEPEQFAELYLQHVRCLLLVRPTDPLVVRSLARAQDLAVTPAAKAQVAFHRARLQSVIGHYPNYRKHLAEAWDHALAAEAPRLASTVAAHLGQAYMWLGQPKSAADWFDKGHAAAASSQSPVVVAYTNAMLGPYLLARGEIREAERISAEAMQTFRDGQHPRGCWGVLPTWAHALRAQGRFSEALAELYASLPEVRESESPSHYVSLLLVTARCEVDLFRLGKAQECVDELEATVRAGELLHLRLEAKLIRGRILLASGQYRDAYSVLQDTQQRARAAEQTSISETARSLLAETSWALGDREEARQLFRNASIGLMGTGDVVALAEAYAVWAKAVADEEEPTALFKPVQAFLDGQPTVLLQMEQLIAKARYLRARGERIPAFHAFREAATLLNRIASLLDDTDRAALRVHPWSRQIRQGLK